MTYEDGYNRIMKFAFDDESKSAPELSQRDSDVNYTPSSAEKGRSCDKCEHYTQNGACKIVQGSINPNGICDRFVDSTMPGPVRM